MALEPIWERSLSRYGDALFRLALLREPSASRAAAAVERAWAALDWRAVELDDRLEGRLVGHLPPSRRLYRPSLPPLPPAFWRLPAAARLALGLRLQRGYSTTAISEALSRPVDEVRVLLLRAIVSLAGEDFDLLPQVCRSTHAARLDEPAANRGHVLGCDRCRTLVPALERSEQAVTGALARATAGATLPRASVHRIRVKLTGDVPDGRAYAWCHPMLLRIALVVAVLVALAALIVPRGRASTTARPSSSARTMLEQSLARYGAPLEGEGILHRRYRFDLGSANRVLQGETWIDLARPARHRMQLFEDEHLREAQAGDGEQRLRYLASVSHGSCGRNPGGVSLRAGDLHVWTAGADEQIRMRDARWRFGPWAYGRHFLELAVAADRLRSLGTITNDGGAVLTLSAQGEAFDGTLLLELDARTGDLREVREVRDDAASTRSRTLWQMLDEERITVDEAKWMAIFSDLPGSSGRPVAPRRLPILDPACPLYGVEHALNPPAALQFGRVWFETMPAGTERAFIAGDPGPSVSGGSGNSGSATIIYLGEDRRIALTERFGSFSLPLSAEPVQSGDWSVQIDPVTPGRFEGLGLRRQLDAPELRFYFVADGWSRDELLQMFETLRQLRFSHWLAQRQSFFDPDPPPEELVVLAEQALAELEPRPGQVQHVVVDTDRREEPRRARLRDPYHRKMENGTTETWVRFAADGKLDRLRQHFETFDGSSPNVTWGDSTSTRIYNERANHVMHYGYAFAWAAPSERLGEFVTNLFLHRQYDIVPAGPSIELSSTLPISATSYEWIVREQQAGLPYANDRPWLVDLRPASISFSTTFDARSGRLQSAFVIANGPRGARMIERTEVRRWESAASEPEDGWLFVPPADATVLNWSRNEDFGRGPVPARNLQEVIDATPTRLWGWEDGASRFLGGRIPPPNAASPRPFAGLEEAIQTGAAVELRYELGGPEEFTLLEGPVALLRPILQNTPPTWLASEERTLPVAGQERTLWVMYADDTRWAIVELDATLIVIRYRGYRSLEDWFSTFNRLVPLDDDRCVRYGLEQPCSEIIPAP